MHMVMSYDSNMKPVGKYVTLNGFLCRFSAKERFEIEVNARKLAGEMMTLVKPPPRVGRLPARLDRHK